MFVYCFLFLLLLLIKHYNLFKVLACSTTFFHLSLFGATFLQLHTLMLFISSKTPSPRRLLGLPIGLLDMGFHFLIFFTSLSSAMRSTRPNQFSLCFLINPIVFCPFNMPLISWPACYLGNAILSSKRMNFPKSVIFLFYPCVSHMSITTLIIMEVSLNERQNNLKHLGGTYLSKNAATCVLNTNTHHL